jgi:hypothetical protein
LRQEGNFFADRPARAMEMYKQAAAVARQLGNRRALVEVLRGMASVAVRQLQDDEAEQRYREIAQLIHDEGLSEKIWAEVDLPELLEAEGRIAESERCFSRFT